MSLEAFLRANPMTFKLEAGGPGMMGWMMGRSPSNQKDVNLNEGRLISYFGRVGEPLDFHEYCSPI